MKKIILLLTALFLISIPAFAGEMTLLKRTIRVTPQRFMRYWKNPKAAEPVYNTYSWIPKISFEMLGPVEGGSKIYVEFDTPDGKPWMKTQMKTPELGDDEWELIKADSVDDNELEKQAILSEGVFPFRIKMKNALNGTDKVLFSGKYKVGTYLLDQNIPDFKGKKDFFVDYDWMLPIAYVWLNPSGDENVPQLATQVCFRGAVDSAKLEAYLFQNGKQVAKQTVSENSQRVAYSSGADEPSHRWAIWEFSFATVRGFNKSQSSNDWSGVYFIDKHPGDYEIKILRDNQLARSIKFTVGSDGNIVDNNIAKQAKLGGVRMIFPAKIVGTLDGQYNANIWTTDALFGNPLVGFSAQ